MLSCTIRLPLNGSYTAVSSGAWAKLRDWASVAGKGRLLLSGSVAHASLETAVVSQNSYFAHLHHGAGRPPQSDTYRGFE